MLMFESNVMEVLDQINEKSTTSMRETARLLHKRRKQLAEGRDPGEMRRKMLEQVGLVDTEDEIHNVSRAYQQHKQALETPDSRGGR
jgi:predicted transcriptional regulator